MSLLRSPKKEVFFIPSIPRPFLIFDSKNLYFILFFVFYRFYLFLFILFLVVFSWFFIFSQHCFLNLTKIFICFSKIFQFLTFPLLFFSDLLSLVLVESSKLRFQMFLIHTFVSIIFFLFSSFVHFFVFMLFTNFVEFFLLFFSNRNTLYLFLKF